MNIELFVQVRWRPHFHCQKLYRTAAFLTSDETVKEAGCECCAGTSGVCEHVAVLLWLLLDAGRCGASYIKDTSTICTEK